MTWHPTESETEVMAHPSDPRVVMIIEPDPEPLPPWGDALCPAYYLEHRFGWHLERAGDVYHDDASDEIAERYLTARAKFREDCGYRYDGLSARMVRDSEAMLERWLRIFYDTQALEFDGGYRNERTMLLLDTPEYRAHVGRQDTLMNLSAEELFAGEASEWRAYLDGDVFIVGVLVNPDHTLAFTDARQIPVGEGDGWEYRDGPVGGHYDWQWATERVREMGDDMAEHLGLTMPMVGQR